MRDLVWKSIAAILFLCLRSEISDQLLISSAAFVIEHPDQADNYRARSVGGMAGVLKAYNSIIKTEPQAKSSVP